MRSLFRRTRPTDDHTGDPDHILVHHAGEAYRVTVKRRAGARRMTLRVSGATGEAVLTLPERTPLSRAREFANAHGGWLATRLERVPERVPLLPGAIVPLRGEPHRIVHLEGQRSPARAGRDADGAAIISVGGEVAHVPRRLRDFLVREAERDLRAAVERHTAVLGRRAASVTVRDTTSRWGSCSAAGRLNFSWRLILAPPFVLDYLAAHEVAHLQEMNHSVRFWRLTKQLCPRTDEAEAWLKRHGTILHRYG
ncbi:MAG: SprT family zinc-dependent metalloprotease [Pseudomonadota bacterium]|jgi:Predicted metal-dependent hydrolase